MNLSETEPDGTIKDVVSSEQHDIPWDDPYPFFVGMIPKPEEPVHEDLMILDRSGKAEEILFVLRVYS